MPLLCIEMLFDTLPTRFWSYTAPTTGGITVTTPVTIYSPNIGDRAYIKNVSLWNYVVSGSTVVEIASSGSVLTVLWRGEVGQYCPGVAMQFDPPLRGGAGAAITLQCLSGGQKVWPNVSGFFESS